MRRNLELLPPAVYEQSLEKRSKELIKVIKSKTALIQEEKDLKYAGKIRIVRHKKALQFYQITEKNDTTGKYLLRSQDDFARRLIQYDYDTKILNAAKRELTAIKRLLAQNNKSGVQGSFLRLSKNRRSLIEPVTLPDDVYARLWLSRKYAGNSYFNSTEYFSAKGEHVRSKSEVIIADTLLRLKIPYRYEFPLELKSGYTIYPDFCCLNLRTREEIFWEHFGLMDDPSYVNEAIYKIQQMQENGFLLGKNFIFTMENGCMPLSPKAVQETAEKYLA